MPPFLTAVYPISTMFLISTNAPVPTDFPQQSTNTVPSTSLFPQSDCLSRFHNYPWAGEWQLGGPWRGLTPDDYNVDGPVGRYIVVSSNIATGSSKLHKH